MVEELDPAALRALLDADEDLQLVDVRPPAGFRSGHIPGSENVPLERLITSIGSVSWGDRVVFVCPYGQSSRQAGELLLAFEGTPDGIEVYNLEGGLQAWDGPLAVAGRD